MRRADEAGRKGFTIGLATILVLLTGAIIWRERLHQSNWAGQLAMAAALQEQLATCNAELATEQARSLNLENALQDQQITIQSLQDRTANLEAQRDHLRAETDRLAIRNNQSSTALEAMQEQLEEARSALLEAQSRPRELAGQLGANVERIEGLEIQIDTQAALLSHLPKQLEVDALSSDRKVFSLKGELSEGTELPASILLCGLEGIYLEGWMHRREGDLLICHVQQWQVDTSKLVKGQKVFILPRHIYEADQ